MKVRGTFVVCMSIIVSTITMTLPGQARSQTGIASVYGNGDGYAGRKTANGERNETPCHDSGAPNSAVWHSGCRCQPKER